MLINVQVYYRRRVFSSTVGGPSTEIDRYVDYVDLPNVSVEEIAARGFWLPSDPTRYVPPGAIVEIRKT